MQIPQRALGVDLIADPFAQLAGATGATGAITEVAARQLLAVARTLTPSLFQFATGSGLVANAQNIHLTFMTPVVVVRVDRKLIWVLLALERGRRNIDACGCIHL